MADIWDNIKNKNVYGVKPISKEERAALLWKVDAIFSKMKLPSEQKALAAAIFNVESSLTRRQKGHLKLKKGLGNLTIAHG